MECVRGRVQVLEDEVCVHEIERSVVEGQPCAQVGGDEAIECSVLAPRVRVHVHADEERDSVAIRRQSRRAAAAGLEHARVSHQRVGEKARLDFRVGRLESHAAVPG
jgi:hypothetical protein